MMHSMKRLLFRTTAILVSFAACSGNSDTEGGNPNTSGGGTVAEASAQTMLSLLEGRIETARDKFVQLAEAIPEERYDWRPMDGVRSFREVFIHIAADNWAPIVMGVQMPEDIPVTTDMDSFRAYQDQGLTKAQTVVEVRRSFDFILQALDETRGRLGEQVMFGEREWDIDEMWVALVTHMHEHLGQTIAYARANEIVPPWSR